MSPLWTIDAGGTGTAVAGPGGRRRYGSINPASSPDADTVLRKVFADLAASLGGRVGEGWIATATIDPRDPGSELERLRRTAERAGLRGRVVVSNDALPWLVAPPLSGRGVAVVCGTGSGFLAGDGRSPAVRVGSCEYLGSDEGSAYDLGLSGLRAAVRALDGRGPDTALTRHFSVATARDLARRAYPKAGVAALAPVVVRAWLDDDLVAGDLVTNAIAELGLGVRAAAAAAGLEGEWTVAAGGGVFLGCPEFLQLFRGEVLGEVVAVTDPNATIGAALAAGVPDWALDDCAWTLTLADPPRPAAQQTTATGPIALGLCLAAWGGGSLAEALDAARATGVDAVDLPTDTTSGLVDADRWATDATYRSELREALTGVAVTCVSNSRDTQLLLGPHGPHTDPVLAGSPDEKRAHALRHAEQAIRIAADLGARQVRLMFGVPDLSRWLSWWHSGVSWADNVEAWAEAAEPVLKLASEHGVRVLVEPHPKQVAYDPDSTRAVLDAADVDVCLDVANLAAVGYDPVSVVRGWGTRLGAAHAKDLQRWTGTDRPPGAGWSRYGPGPSIRFRSLGSGDLPWPGVVAALLDEGFRGVLYVEHEDALLPREQS
ncbi:MAG TPA: TIM barrel protein, partial [Umezawaea sp.]|nr:TIM barrel protein [Umezawaea sp.]